MESARGSAAGRRAATGLPPAFVLREVRKERGGAAVLAGVDLEIPEGRVTALVGPSGAGKTSLLRLLNRLDDPSGGEIRFRGRPLGDYSVTELRCQVGFVFQTPVMFPGTVRDNLRVAAELAGNTDRLEARMRDALELAELQWELLDREGNSLSVGQKQRANIARSLMTGLQVLLMDEPTSALDPETADRLMETVRHLRDQRELTVVMITHRLAEARRASDVTVVMEAGRVIEVGPTEEVFEQTENARLRAFLASGG